MSYKVEFSSDLFRYGTKLEEMPITLLSSIRYILENLPEGITYNINVTGKDGKTYEHIDEYVDDRIEEFFDIPDEMYEKTVGKCFMNSKKDIAVKVVGLTDDKYEFLFEKYEKYGHDEKTWNVQDYNTLQERLTSEYTKEEEKKKYQEYALTDQTDINLCGENMFHIGKDGNLYVDMTCGDDYDVYTPIKESTFELIKAEALENSKE